MVPTVDVAPLFAGGQAARAAVDARIAAAAAETGFLSIVGLGAQAPLGPAARAALLAIFALEPQAQRRLWRRKFAPGNANLYRGFFPAQPGNVTLKEGIDLGPDVLYGPRVTRADDPLREPTPLPQEAELPGWRAAVAAYYGAMERIARALMQSIARGLELAPDYFDAAFHEGLSTLRLLRYPARAEAELARCAAPGVWVEYGGARRYLTGAAHTDSGFLTLLAQDGVPGLQARARDGSWADVPPEEGALAVNFGQVLERWSGGRIRATEHRVIGSGAERCSIPFFYEARADAEIRPLPQDDPASFAPFCYGDHLWARMTGFVEFRGMERERQPARAG
ncbi:MAG TPA: 2OG-Fe(II) oxygenase family protein [Steroidobacteraceae bacterium]|nr:2OG-Fe(II) oxygenase family protein [Steroidobacteraceae bacterium]